MCINLKAYAGVRLEVKKVMMRSMLATMKAKLCTLKVGAASHPMTAAEASDQKFSI